MHLCQYQIYSFTALQVCNYHQQYYRPENLCVIITGQIDPNKVFEAVNPFEEKIIGKVSNLFVQVYSISQFCAKTQFLCENMFSSCWLNTVEYCFLHSNCLQQCLSTSNIAHLKLKVSDYLKLAGVNGILDCSRRDSKRCK